MKILHLCWGLGTNNGAANIARLIISEQQAAGHEVVLKTRYSRAEIAESDEIWCHCGWYWRIWLVVAWARKAGKKIYWMPECCYDPVRLRFHGWKKWLVGPIERRALRKCDVIVATCAAEKRWIEAYVGEGVKVEVNDIKRFFNLQGKDEARKTTDGGLHILYLGRRHPLKGVEYLERAVRELAVDGSRRAELRIVSDHFGEELEKDWAWCDVLCLPTLSENFGLVVAEALERGKRVITTDGAPVWAPPEVAQPRSSDMAEPWRDRLCYLEGYRDGTDEERVRMLVEAISNILSQ